MADIRILTDIRINQCPIWCQETEYLFNNHLQTTEKNSLLHRITILLRKRKQYDVVITADIRTAQVFGFIRTLFQWKEPKHIVLELMLDEPREDILWKIKKNLQKLCFSSVEIVFVSSRRETEIYASRLGLPSDRFKFLPFHTNVIEPRMIEGTGGYVFSAGKTGRDYATLAAVAKDLPAKVIVVTDRHHIQGVHFPPNVEVYCDIPYERYMELLHGCKMVVVPLRRVVKSTGQVVFLEAMALGKPVIATLTTGTQDYIENGVTGLLVPPEDCGALRNSIEQLLADPSLRAAIARRALEAVRKRHTFEMYTRSILETAQAISGCSR